MDFKLPVLKNYSSNNNATITINTPPSPKSPDQPIPSLLENEPPITAKQRGEIARRTQNFYNEIEKEAYKESVENSTLSTRFFVGSAPLPLKYKSTKEQHFHHSMGPLWCSNSCCASGNFVYVTSYHKF